VITPCGKIYLLGGEEPELVTRDDVYMYDTCTASGSLTLRSPMLQKKYDFTCCVLDGFIYVISGRDTSAEIVDRCERYEYSKDKWSSIASVKRKRYAASSASMSGHKKIYLFGGRTESNNNMLEDIEEYDVTNDIWKLVVLKDPSVWVPVEVSAMIQVEEDKLLIFGGSDSRVKDCPNSYTFNVTDYSLERTDDLKRAQVFVAAPVCYGRKVYAVGNEYYVKNRSLNRFHIDNREWTIIF
jgi:N-acetylneuraminic acid mutarotase